MAFPEVAAASPEELETLLEDALVLRDDAAVEALFEPWDVLVAVAGSISRGRVGTELLSRQGYVASPRSVRVVSGAAVIVGEHAVTVSCRGPDRSWRLLAVIVAPAQDISSRPFTANS